MTNLYQIKFRDFCTYIIGEREEKVFERMRRVLLDPKNPQEFNDSKIEEHVIFIGNLDEVLNNHGKRIL